MGGGGLEQRGALIRFADQLFIISAPVPGLSVSLSALGYAVQPPTLLSDAAGATRKTRRRGGDGVVVGWSEGGRDGMGGWVGSKGVGGRWEVGGRGGYRPES